MALDYMAIVSLGTYPTPGASSTRRAALAVSFGLLNFDLPEGSIIESVYNIIFNIGRAGMAFMKGIFKIG